MASTMEPSCNSRRRDDSEFNLREWSIKARINRENANSRRHSASYIRSFKEDTRSFRSNLAISSTASSPGFSFQDEIDPSTYSFSTALKALQVRSGYNSVECLSPEGFALNSKWNEAEKYICNPLSGEVPMECLSAKTLSGKSFQSLTNRIIMSAPFVTNSSNHIQAKPSTHQQHDLALKKKKEAIQTRDVGTQSTLHYVSSSSCSPTSSPSIIDRSVKPIKESLNSMTRMKSEKEVEVKDEENGETKEVEREKENEWKKKDMQFCRQSGCFSWIRKKKQREKEVQRKNNVFLTTHCKGF